jgi:hypothetical protein
MYPQNRLETCAKEVQAASLRPPTVTEQVEQQLENAKKEVVRCSELLDLLTKNPEINRILELMQRQF